MIKDEHIEYWLGGAKENFKDSLDIYDSKKYDWALYIAHLSLEKLLKALFVRNTDNFVPPKTHNLLKLAKFSGINLSEGQMELLTDLNRFQIEARYPMHKNELKKIATKEFTDQYLFKIKEIYSWLMSQIQ